MLDIYEYNQYTQYLRDLTKRADSPLTVKELADAAHVQRPYISNVLAEKAHLSREQGFRLAKHLGLDDTGMNYFLNLIEIERAGSPQYQAYLEEKGLMMKKDSEQLKNKLKRNPPVLAQEIATEYFSSWEYCAVHLLTSIPEFRTLRKIAKALHLTPREAQFFIDKLVGWGLVGKVKDGYRWSSGNVHLPAGSPITRLHQRNWREQAVENSKINDETSVHFTSVYSMTNSDAEKARSKILKVIKEYNEQASRSKEETLVCLNVDLFNVTSP
ncbi:TIGR02147 family protein [Bdellovibrio sp. HCB337]|uniref:TIGR02147 family protein n=1 Tax=Bdellovibrio sp. HCB337 TaxID=3394358 RepID=UPI0039A75CF2